jgi:hypothetical protein
MHASSSSSSGRPASAASNASAQSDPSDISERDMSAAIREPGRQVAGAMRAFDGVIPVDVDVSSPVAHVSESSRMRTSKAMKASEKVPKPK